MRIAILFPLVLATLVPSLSGYSYASEAQIRQPFALQLENLGPDLLKPKMPASRAMRDLDLKPRQLNPSEDDSLRKIVRHMQHAHSLLEQSHAADSASSAQSRAIVEIDSMITELVRRQSKCRGGKSQPDFKTKPGSPKPGSNPGTSSSMTSSQSGDLAASLEATGELVRDLWGHLPERQRQQILQPLNEDFLPAYATDIEDYFRALADPDRTNSELP